MELEEKNTPAIHAVIRHARVAATRARNPIAAMSLLREGTRAATPPTKIAIEATCAKPQRAYAVMTVDLGSLGTADHALSWFDTIAARTPEGDTPALPGIFDVSRIVDKLLC